MGLPRRGVVLPDPGFPEAVLVRPTKGLEVPLMALPKIALRGMGRHGEQAEVHGRLLIGSVHYGQRALERTGTTNLRPSRRVAARAPHSISRRRSCRAANEGAVPGAGAGAAARPPGSGPGPAAILRRPSRLTPPAPGTDARLPLHFRRPLRPAGLRRPRGVRRRAGPGRSGLSRRTRRIHPRRGAPPGRAALLRMPERRLRRLPGPGSSPAGSTCRRAQGCAA